MILDRKLNWRKYIFTKRKQLGIQLMYKATLKPIWTYGIQLWETRSNSNIKILQNYQNKVLRLIVSAPWYVSNLVIQRDLQIPSVKREISKHSQKYSDRVKVHSNVLVKSIMEETTEPRCLKCFKPSNLLSRFS